MPRTTIGPAGSLPDGSSNPISPAVRAGDFVYVSGLMPKGPDGKIIDGDISVQTTAVMKRLSDALKSAGCEFSDVVKCMVWLTDADDFKAFNTAYAPYFDGDPPARSAVRSDLLLPGARLELEAICYKPLTA
ncbi:MAG: RidA family protein [Alphaproteobacteria bacterium]|nr:RidA family protein [Alphaproteobacteria bacterium]